MQSLKQQFSECNSIELINGKSQTNRDQKSNLLFLQQHNIKEFNSSLLKIDKKSYKDIDIYYIGYITIKKIGDYENIYSVNPLYLTNGKVDGHIKESNENIYFLILQMKTKKYLKNTLKFGMVLKMKLKQ